MLLKNNGQMVIPCPYNQPSNTSFIIDNSPFIPLHVSFWGWFHFSSKVVLDVLFNLIPPTDHMLEGGGDRRGTEICSASCTCLGLDLPIYRQTWAAGISEMSHQGNRQGPSLCGGPCEGILIDGYGCALKTLCCDWALLFHPCLFWTAWDSRAVFKASLGQEWNKGS